MTTTSNRQTATIYQFPAGGRAGRASVSNRAVSGAIGSLHRFSKAEAQAQPVINYGNWYHEEALREVEVAGKH